MGNAAGRVLHSVPFLTSWVLTLKRPLGAKAPASVIILRAWRVKVQPAKQSAWRNILCLSKRASSNASNCFSCQRAPWRARRAALVIFYWSKRPSTHNHVFHIWIRALPRLELSLKTDIYPTWTKLCRLGVGLAMKEWFGGVTWVWTTKRFLL